MTRREFPDLAPQEDHHYRPSPWVVVLTIAIWSGALALWLI